MDYFEKNGIVGLRKTLGCAFGKRQSRNEQQRHFASIYDAVSKCQPKLACPIDKPNTGLHLTGQKWQNIGSKRM
ncbi:MAG: hypothetical protein J1F05_05190 [Muribaculaceae bacterium]|nr:hypothetical protein [Muribaculaceae bacterium]